MPKLVSPILLLAYSKGYFPMPHPDTGEIMWLSPDPRAVIPLDGFHVSRSLAKSLAKEDFVVTVDQDFLGVMRGCGDRKETWITNEFLDAYGRLFQEGFAHSVEVRDAATRDLIGGVYGVALRGAFFAESMFHRRTDASKIALKCLVDRLRAGGFVLLEVQFLTPHLASLGAVEIPAEEYHRKLDQALMLPPGRLASL